MIKNKKKKVLDVFDGSFFLEILSERAISYLISGPIKKVWETQTCMLHLKICFKKLEIIFYYLKDCKFL